MVLTWDLVETNGSRLRYRRRHLTIVHTEKWFDWKI